MVNLTDPALRFGMVDGLKCLEKETKRTKTLYNENLDCVHVLKSVHEPSVSVKNRSLRDSSRMRTRTCTRNGSMDAFLSISKCLSIFYHCFDFNGH